MKRSKFSFLLAVLLVMSILLTSCNSGSGSPSSDSKSGDDKVYMLNMSTASVGTAFYNIGAGISSVVQEAHDNIRINAQISSGSGENLVNIASGDAELALMATDFVYWGSRGGKQDLSEAYVDASENMSVMMVLEPMIFVCITQEENTKYQTAEDVSIPGTRLSIGPTGSSQYVGWQWILQGMGHTFDDFDTYQGGHAQQADALRDNNVDVLVNVVAGLSNPNATYAELAVTDDIRFLPLSEKTRDEVVRIAPMYTKVTIPVGWTVDNHEEVPALGVRVVLCVKKDLPEDVVYNIVDAMMNGLDELNVVHKCFGSVTKDNAATDLPAELHPGAKKYYEEHGYTITYLPEVD